MMLNLKEIQTIACMLMGIPIFACGVYFPGWMMDRALIKYWKWYCVLTKGDLREDGQGELGMAYVLTFLGAAGIIVPIIVICMYLFVVDMGFMEFITYPWNNRQPK